MKSIIGNSIIAAQCADILYDESRFSLGIPSELHYPASTNDVIEIVKQAHASKTPVTIIGAQTGITGASVPVQDSIAISMKEMNSIVRMDPGATPPGLVCQPGVTLDEIENFLVNHNNTTCLVVKNTDCKIGTWSYPPDPTEMSAQLGGTIATNASGARSFYYGPTRNHISALTIVLASGETLSIKRGQICEHEGFSFVSDQGTHFSIPAIDVPSLSIKNASGYYLKKGMDIIDLLIGSEGTLGIITEARIQLVKRPEYIGGLSFFPSQTGAFAFADFLRTQKGVIAIEYFDGSALSLFASNRETSPLKLAAFPFNAAAVYWEYSADYATSFDDCFDTWEEILTRQGSSFDSTWSGFDAAEMHKLKEFRHAIPETVNTTIARYKQTYPYIRKIGTDTAVDADHFSTLFSRYSELIKASDIEYAVFGHIGDYHLHFNLLPKSDVEYTLAQKIYAKLMEIAISYGGTVSAEHGIGKIKKDHLLKMYNAKTIGIMKKIKDVLDPDWILSPGNLFDR